MHIFFHFGKRRATALETSILANERATDLETSILANERATDLEMHIFFHFGKRTSYRFGNFHFGM
jgi:hypothetical protein